MGQSESKSRKKGPSPPATSGQPTGRLYPNLANEFPAYGRPNPVDFNTPANTNTYEACFGNSMPNNGPRASYPYNPSAPSEALCGFGQSLATRTGMQTIQAEPAGNSSSFDTNNQERKPCPNASIGCKLHFNATEMKQHLKECLFGDIRCPLNGVAGKCSWRDKVTNITTHFEDNHPENVGHVNQEQTLTNLRTIHLVELKPFKFLVHIKVDEAEKKTLVLVQHYSTQFCASKWTYEFEFKGPHMEKKLEGTCITTGVSVEEKFKRLQCRVLDMSICVMDGFKHGGLKYKYRIMKREHVGGFKKEAKCSLTKEVSSKNMCRDVTKHVVVTKKLETNKKEKGKETKGKIRV